MKTFLKNNNKTRKSLMVSLLIAVIYLISTVACILAEYILEVSGLTHADILFAAMIIPCIWTGLRVYLLRKSSDLVIGIVGIFGCFMVLLPLYSAIVSVVSIMLIIDIVILLIKNVDELIY